MVRALFLSSRCRTLRNATSRVAENEENLVSNGVCGRKMRVYCFLVPQGKYNISTKSKQNKAFVKQENDQGVFKLEGSLP